MKKLISLVLALAMLLASVALLASCDDEAAPDGATQNKDGTISYDALGLKFRLPDYFRKRTYDYYELAYATPGATFLVNVMYKEEIEDEEMGYQFDFDITVEEYVKLLIELNEYECSYVYDAERDVASFYLFYSLDDVEYDYEYYTVLKNEGALYVVLMYCAEADYENYEPLFRLWSSYLSAN